MGKYHKKTPICPNENCDNWESKAYHYQGVLCKKCEKLLKEEYTQGVKCESCGIIHHIRDRINTIEPKYIIKGLCYWCAERQKEEKGYKTNKKNIETYTFGSVQFAKDVLENIKDTNNGKI